VSAEEKPQKKQSGWKPCDMNNNYTPDRVFEKNKSIMVLYYLKTALKSISRNLKFSLINVLGFAFGLSACLGIALFLVQELTHDKHNQNFASIIRLTDSKSNSSGIDYRVKTLLLENYPQVLNGCLVQVYNEPTTISIDQHGFSVDGLMSVDNQFFEVFSVRFRSGNPLKPFFDLNSAVITVSTAEKLFGTTDVLGKEISIFNNLVVVVGVIEDFPTTSSISASLIVNAENEKFKFSMSMVNSDDLSSYRWPFEIFLQLDKGINPVELLDKMNSQIGILNPYVDGLGFISLKNLYLYDKSIDSGTKKGNPSLLLLLAVIALVILILAIINYINLTVSQQLKKSRDVGVRKTIGAKRGEIIIQHLSESVIISIFSIIIGFFLMVFALPFYNSIFGATLDPAIYTKFPGVIILLAIVILLGIVSGIGPAMVLTRITAIKALNRNFIISSKKFSLRNVLSVFQFTVSIALVICVLIVHRQVGFVKHKNPGFAVEQLMHLSISSSFYSSDTKVQHLMDELRKSPYIVSISASCGVPGEISYRMGTNMKDSEKNFNAPVIIADTTFLSTFKLNVTNGRNLQKGDFGRVCLMNETAFRHFEFESLDNKRFMNYSRNGFEIIGVVNDFHFSSLHSSIDPMFIIISPTFYVTSVSIRFDGRSVAEVIKHINTTWQQIMPEHVLKYSFFDEWFASMYQKEERFASTIGFFALLAVVISCIGILGLAIFSSERRTKEIGIRKVNGVKIWQVMLMLNMDFVKWVAIAFVIATPIAYYVMDKWLQNFAYRTPLSWWVFALAGLLALAIALLTVSWQSWWAARRNPVEALRYE
jgi:putative ABC transport system permease protein